MPLTCSDFLRGSQITVDAETGIGVSAHDGPLIVDPEGNSSGSAWNIQRGEGAAAQQEAVQSANGVHPAVGGVTVIAGDVAVIVQAADRGEVADGGLRRPRVVNGNERPI